MELKMPGLISINQILCDSTRLIQMVYDFFHFFFVFILLLRRKQATNIFISFVFPSNFIYSQSVGI